MLSYDMFNHGLTNKLQLDEFIQHIEIKKYQGYFDLVQYASLLSEDQIS